MTRQMPAPADINWRKDICSTEDGMKCDVIFVGANLFIINIYVMV